MSKRRGVRRHMGGNRPECASLALLVVRCLACVFYGRQIKIRSACGKEIHKCIFHMCPCIIADFAGCATCAQLSRQTCEDALGYYSAWLLVVVATARTSNASPLPATPRYRVDETISASTALRGGITPMYLMGASLLDLICGVRSRGNLRCSSLAQLGSRCSS
jgi:hypothetical protein